MTWERVNQNLVAKAIGELTYEEVFKPKDNELHLSSGVVYQFRATQNIWGGLTVNPLSLIRVFQGVQSPVNCAGQFFIDAQKNLTMDDITLGNFLEEMYSTLHADCHLFKKNNSLTADELASWDGLRLQSVLSGHPKILLNKGRMKWGSEDFKRYSPESAKPFQLRWLSVYQDSAHSQLLSDELYLNSFSADELAMLITKDFILIPVHPWQWDHIISLQYAALIACGKIIDLGERGDFYFPQISLRTLSNVSRPNKLDIKVSLSILNTSAVRGIAGKYIPHIKTLSTELAKICQSDPLLVERQTNILVESGGVSVTHPLFAQIEQAPYRYHETLGAIWRQSAEAFLANDEQAILTGALAHQDQHGHSLIEAYVKKSAISLSQWLTHYFDVVVIPLYHLQLKYGIGIVAHGQNIVLKLKNSIPVGMFLKDFQGDLRLCDEAKETQKIFPHLSHLPAHYLIHDLITGHFVTVLRFISQVLTLPEKEFYQLLANRVEVYHQTYQQNGVDERKNILQPKLKRLLVNKVRFKIGYADSSERPLPMLGEDLINPLAQETNYED